MNVLIINTFDIKGGAARAAYRLNKGFNRIGINSVMLVKEKQSQDERVRQINPVIEDDALKELKIVDAIRKNYIINNRTSISNTIFSLNYPGYDLTELEIVKKAEVINLHWVNKFQSVESIYSIIKLGKPIVWTIHDENSFTGGCHYSAGCTLYKVDCKTCPQLADDPYHLPYYNLKNKIDLLGNKNITIVSPSKWLAKEAKESALFRYSTVVTIPNSIETDLYSPQNKEETKRKLGIGEHTVTILTAISGWQPRRKGFSHFLSAMRYCSKNKKFKDFVRKNKLLLLCFGTPADEFIGLKIPFKSFGKVDCDKKLCDIYNASDIFVLPSLEDNLPNTMMEAMSCGIPVIAFNAGGMPDMIEDDLTGRLIPCGSDKKFAKAVQDLIFNDGKRSTMGKKSRELIEKKYKLEDQAQKYAELFSRLLPKGHSSNGNSDFQENQYCKLDLSFNKLLLPLYRKYANA
ncbi:MAG: glycosyltransferase [Candidatus Aminicenantes bacterium]|jgi:glycosyltransferase involved in cell wall biosynthesis